MSKEPKKMLIGYSPRMEKVVRRTYVSVEEHEAEVTKLKTANTRLKLKLHRLKKEATHAKS